MGKRRRSREAAYQMAYASELSRGRSQDVLVTARLMADGDLQPLDAFAGQLLEWLDEHLERIDRAIAAALKNWSPERLSSPDRALLRLAVAELMYSRDIPERVTMNEYIELAKKYGDAESARFINGVLDGVVKQRRGEGQDEGAKDKTPQKEQSVGSS